MTNKKDAASLNRLNYAAFENIVYPRCHGYIEYVNVTGTRVREKCTRQNVDLYVLLRSGYSDEDWNEYYPYSANDSSIKSRLSNMRRLSDGYKYIRDYEIATYSAADVRDRVRPYFEKHLLPLISKTDRKQLIDDLHKLVGNDLTLPSDEFHNISRAFETRDFLTIVTEAFIISMIRETLPADIAYRRYAPEDYGLFPEIEEYILATHENGFSQDAFVDTLDWLHDKMDIFSEYHADDARMEEYVKTGWNTVAFWKASYCLVDRNQFSDETKKKYERVRLNAFRFEADEFLWSIRATEYEISKRYDYPMILSMSYDDLNGEPWKIEIASYVKDDPFGSKNHSETTE